MEIKKLKSSLSGNRHAESQKTSREWPFVSSECYIEPTHWTIYGFLPAITLNYLGVIEKANTAFVSMINGESVSCGEMVTLTMWRLWITTNEGYEKNDSSEN